MRVGVPRWLPGPSLLRRVVLALLGAFVLVWCALLAMDYGSFKEAAFNRQALRSAQALADSLGDSSAAEAALMVRVTEDLYNRSRRDSGLEGVGELLFVLTEAGSGQRIYASKALAGSTVDADAGGARPVQIAGRAHWSVVRQTPRWRLLVFEPVVGDGALMRWLGREQLAPMLVALPLVLLPLWLAVWSGLMPLRELTARVASRDPADVSGLGLALRHAELRPLVTAFDQLLSKARQGIARERAFVQDAAHELRTPLAVVTAQAHALTEATDPDGRREAKAALERAVGRASHLVHQLLTLARVEGPPRQQGVDLVEVTRQVLIAAAPSAAQRGMDVSLESPDRIDANLDMESFHTIVDNLLRNAIAYCPAGARVEVRLALVGQRVRLELRDDGPGIAPEDAPHLFERFHRGRHAQAPGSGLGLTIVRQAAQAMGGTVTQASGIDGRGAGFVVDIDRVDASPPPRG